MDFHKKNRECNERPALTYKQKQLRDFQGYDYKSNDSMIKLCSSIIKIMEETGTGQFVKPIERFDGVKVNMEIRQKHLHSKKRKVKTWSPQQDQQLIALYEEYPKKWAIISELMHDRNENQCLHRYRRLSQLGAHRKIWSAEEDESVKKLMKKIGKNWKLLSEMLGTKTGKQIRERFINKLDPKIKKEDWTDEEDRKIIELYSELGRKWSQISKHLQGRPQNKIKNRFYSYIQKNYDIKYKIIEEKPVLAVRLDMKSENRIRNADQNQSLRSFKEITNKLQNGSMRQIGKEEKYFTSFPSINHIDMELRMDDFPEGQQNRYSKVLVGSMVKIEEEWNQKEKGDGFSASDDIQNDLFYLSMG